MEDILDINEILAVWQRSLVNYVPKIVVATVVATIFYFLAKLSENVGRRFYARVFRRHPDYTEAISSFIYFFFFIAGAFLALEILGLEGVLTKLLAGAGIVGIVAGFAFKDIASNAFAGLLINVQRPFRPGDWVEITENFGTVLSIGYITTSIKNISGQEVFVPNQLVYSNTFTNYSTFNKRRVILQSGVSYGDDLDHVKEVALDEVAKMDVLLKGEATDFYFTGIGNSAYTFEVRFWIKFDNNTDYLNAMSETIMRIKKRFEVENIRITYAVTTLDFGVKGGVGLFDKSISVNQVQGRDIE